MGGLMDVAGLRALVDELKDLEAARPIVTDFFARLLGTHRAAPQ
ncbi:hypothetical protein AB0G81_06850 [Streptomyces asoensis]